MKMKKLSVAYLVPSLNYGGSETLLLDFLRYLDRGRFSPEVHCFYEGDKLVGEYLQAGIVVHQWRASRRNPVSFLKLIREMRRSRYDVAHTHLFDRQGRVAAYLAGVPVIITTYHLVTDWDITNGIADRIKIYLDTLTSRLNDRIIAVSDEERQKAITMGRMDEGRIDTVLNGIDLSPYPATNCVGELRDELRLRGKRVILAIGRLVGQKGHAFLIDAALMLRDDFPDIAVVIVGEGPLHDKLSSMVDKRGLNEVVRLPGARRDIPKLLAMAEVFAMPSLFEGLPITLLEAMASRKPIVATSVDGIRNTLEDGVEALLVPPHDAVALAKALSTFLLDRQYASSAGNAARKKVETRFDIRVHVRKIEDIYLREADRKGILR